MSRRRRRGCRDEQELITLVREDDSQSNTNMTDQEQDQSEEAGPSTGSNLKLRLMVLGGDDALMDKACGTILRERKKYAAFEFGNLEPINADACGRKISVLKTPFTWLEELKSFLSSRVKDIRNEMESFESKMFSGPHAFLLVHRDVKNSGREYYLLKALSEVFGKEVLDYCMVLFMDGAKHNDPKKNKCLKMCGGRHHILHNTDDSVSELFEDIVTMTERKDSSFFTNHLECFSKASKYFQVEYEEKEDKLRKELNHSRDREGQLKKELNDLRNGIKKPREHHRTTADPAVSRDKSRSLEEREEERKSRDDSQASGLFGIQKPVRRNSKGLMPPYMSETL